MTAPRTQAARGTTIRRRPDLMIDSVPGDEEPHVPIDAARSARDRTTVTTARLGSLIARTEGSPARLDV
jgi:hypothetical protein